MGRYDGKYRFLQRLRRRIQTAEASMDMTGFPRSGIRELSWKRTGKPIMAAGIKGLIQAVLQKGRRDSVKYRKQEKE